MRSAFWIVDRRWAIDQGRPVLHQIAKAICTIRSDSRIQRRSRLVQNQNRRVAQNGPSDRHSLALAS